MAVARRLLSSVKVDDYIPQAILCIHCHTEVNLTTAHYGRVVGSWRHSQRHNVELSISPLSGEVFRTPTITEVRYPEKITGHCCNPCYLELFHTTWRDKTGHLRRAFESVLVPVEQPKNDDHDASPITKHLYAPHAGKGDRGYLSETDAKKGDHHKLTGFDRPKRDDINLKGKRVVVRNGRWKEDPAKYNYTPTKKGKANNDQ